MAQESDPRRYSGQQPPDYQQQRTPEQRNPPYGPRQEQSEAGEGETEPTYPTEQRPDRPRYGEPTEEPEPEPSEEECPSPAPPPDLCGPSFICYGPPEWGDDPCGDLRRVAAEGEPQWKYPCKRLLNIIDSSEATTGGDPASVAWDPCAGVIDYPPSDNGKTICIEPCNEIDLQGACDPAGLQAKLEELKRCIATQSTQKAAVDEVIKAAQDQQKELEILVSGFVGILDKYEKARPALLCREDCLRGFVQKTKATLDAKLTLALRKALTDSINIEYCKLRTIECCKQDLDNKLTCTTDLIKERDQLKREADRAESAFKDLKDFAGWIDKRFKTLEDFQKAITETQQSQDENKYRLMFYLFYWKFIPDFCFKFTPQICSEESGTDGNQQRRTSSEIVSMGQKIGDWHPSQIDREALGELICCAWSLVNKTKAKYQREQAEVAAKQSQRTFITDKHKQDVDRLDKTIRDKLAKAKEEQESVVGA
jgi:hypothetical protein